MIRGFFRLVGLLLLAGGFIFMVYDGARWVADQNLRFTPYEDFWNNIHQSSLQAFRTWLEATAPWLWTSVVKVILEQRACARFMARKLYKYFAAFIDGSRSLSFSDASSGGMSAAKYL